ncbi:MAG: sulfotransferase family 2 domain-containing protein [Oceanicaulis sp.]|nr:sulfotransferase family 2 domain-containing protein [Oceanicaulis sp.]
MCASETFIFTSVRNPWDKIVSRYHYGQRESRSIWHKRVEETGSFKKFAMSKEFHYATNFERFCTKNGKRLVDFVIQVEDMQRGVSEVCRRLKIDEIEVPHVNKNARKDNKEYRLFYDDESMNAVGEAYISDINEFGYSF